MTILNKQGLNPLAKEWYPIVVDQSIEQSMSSRNHETFLQGLNPLAKEWYPIVVDQSIEQSMSNRNHETFLQGLNPLAKEWYPADLCRVSRPYHHYYYYYFLDKGRWTAVKNIGILK
jgi:hypothetical protein